MIRFYYNSGPNPLKVALMLEETGLAYEAVPVDMLAGDQHTAAFRAVNPNGKAPAMIDDGVAVFDSNAILLYLGEKTGQFMGAAADRGALYSWLMFVATGVGPYSGQAVHFGRFHTDSAYATNRYRREAARHYEVLEQRLAASPYLAGAAYTIADMALWGWADRAGFVLGDAAALDAYPHVKAWHASVEARPAAARARALGKDVAFKREFDESAQRAMFPQNF
jgi:GST-like protein